MNKTLQSQKGFSMVETLVAITILLFALVGPMTIAADGLQSTFFAREQTTAFYLAQEAIEFVQYERDSAVLAGGSFFDALPAACDPSNVDGCGVEMRSLSFIDCSGEAGEACVIEEDSGGIGTDWGLFTHGGDEATAFTRKMWIDEDVVSQEAEVRVEVTWESGIFDTDRTITIESYIFDIYQP